MMLNINWRQLRKIHLDLQSRHQIADNEQITFLCLTKNTKTGKQQTGRRNCVFKDFLKVFWELCESDLQILKVKVMRQKDVLYNYSEKYIERLPTGGNPNTLLNWAKLTQTHKETLVDITIAQISSHA